jgi:hypothetical protein
MCQSTKYAGSLLLVILLGAAGCGSGRYPVHGRVLYEDGRPLTEGNVIGESTDGGEIVMAQGDVRSDGTFRWGTLKPGDGARPGKYRIAVLPRALGEAEAAKGARPAVAKKFTSFETSGIVYEVKDGRNQLDITVQRPGPKEH